MELCRRCDADEVNMFDQSVEIVLYGSVELLIPPEHLPNNVIAFRLAEFYKSYFVRTAGLACT